MMVFEKRTAARWISLMHLKRCGFGELGSIGQYRWGTRRYGENGDGDGPHITTTDGRAGFHSEEEFSRLSIPENVGMEIIENMSPP